MPKFAKQNPGARLGDYLHPKKDSAINAPMAKPLQPTAQRTPATAMAPIKKMTAKTKSGKGKK